MGLAIARALVLLWRPWHLWGLEVEEGGEVEEEVFREEGNFSSRLLMPRLFDVTFPMVFILPSLAKQVALCDFFLHILRIPPNLGL